MIKENLKVKEFEKEICIKTEYSEIDIVEFIKIRQYLKDLSGLEGARKYNLKSYESLQNDFLNALNQNKLALQEKILEKQKGINDVLESIQEQIRIIEIDILVLISNITYHELNYLDNSIQLDKKAYNNGTVKWWTDKIGLLLMQPLPTYKCSNFFFQGKTDEYIEKLKAELSETNIIRIGQKRKKKRLLTSAKNKEYKIRNIWLHSTLINRHYQSIANKLVEQINNDDDWSLLPYLIAALTSDEQMDNRLIEHINKNKRQFAINKKKYQEVFLQVAKENVAIFTEQKNKLPADIAIKVLNFFLSKWKKSNPLTRAY